jgi:hypothetical protein
LLRTVAAGQNLGAADQKSRIYAEPPAEKSEYDNGSYSETATTARHPESTAGLAASVLDVTTAR